MATWKLCRQTFGNDEFTLKEGEEVTVGRNEDNKIVLTSIVISRNHCVINVKDDRILITDLASSNGVYVGTTKIPRNTPYCVRDSDVIGFGWMMGARLVNIQDNEKFVFKVIRQGYTTPLIERIKFQSELDNLEAVIADLDSKSSAKTSTSPVISKLSLKRKFDDNIPHIKKETPHTNKDVIDLISDSDNEINSKEKCCKKIKLETIREENKKETSQKEAKLKQENEDIDFFSFKTKQEYQDYDVDEAIQIDSDSDDGESYQWLMRLSQSSPGKPFVKVKRESKIEVRPEESSYSQVDDDLVIDLNYVNDEEGEEFLDDIIRIPDEPLQSNEHPEKQIEDDNFDDEINPPLILIPHDDQKYNSMKTANIYESMSGNDDEGIDLVDGGILLNAGEISVNASRGSDNSVSDAVLDKLINENVKQISLIEPQQKKSKHRSSHIYVPIEKKSTSSSRKTRKHESSSKKHISNSQKEERKKKLKDIATKNKEDPTGLPSTSSDSVQGKKQVVNAKVTSSNRGAFLTDVGIVIPTKRKESSPKGKKSKENHEKTGKQSDGDKKDKEKLKKDESKKSLQDKPSKSKKHSKPRTSNETHLSSQDARVPLKSLKPLTDEKVAFSGKPCSKVEPLPLAKPKKKVSFSNKPPQIREFEIEPGNRMKKTSLVKTTQVDGLRQVPVFSLEKLTLMKILRWNPHWLEEQLNTNDPPPILGHNNPLTVFHYFKSHNQYVQLIGDLLLMEIWECLSQAYMKIRNLKTEIPMRIESLPPPSDRYIDLINISVNISMPTSEVRNMPRVGEIILVNFGQEPVKNIKFFFVYNVKNLPSPPYNKNSFFSVSLQSVYTEKMKFLKPGELITGKVLAHISKELMLFEALEYLARTQLCEAILRPAPQFFLNIDQNIPYNKNSRWTQALNASQHRAVAGAVQSALGDQPTIHMVQGPPGTGKSSVICAIVMSYFYDTMGKLERNRGKILICATSNAAVDELVIRLLNIRQSLPKSERFRMVRVGRAEAMHARAREVSSQQLAARDVQRLRADPCPALQEETAHLQAKINMWRTAAQDAKNPERVAYCQDKIAHLNKKIALLSAAGGGAGAAGGAGGAARGEQLAAAEQRVVDKADIVATTLASAHNHKMRVLKGRIALCIVEEAGQAVEAETLVPLTLDVTNLTLIGDPQQLPGYICSQRAKKHGLGESLFARLTSCSEEWPSGNPVVLLNEQYRMHAEIADYPNRAFYDGKIVTCVDRQSELTIPPYMILGVASGDKGQGASGGNELEAWAVCRLVAALLPQVRRHQYSLAVITPYNGHKELVKRNLRNVMEPSECNIEVNTVDSFQGQERDVIVVSVARSCGAGFLADAGRLNVMLTRARRALLLCVHPHSMLRNQQWRTLLEDAQRRQVYRQLPPFMCTPMTPGKNETNEVLSCLVPAKNPR